MERRVLLAAAVIFEGGFLLVAWGLGALLDAPPFERLEPGWRAVALGLVATLPLLAALGWTRRTRWVPMVDLRRTLDAVVDDVFLNCTTADLALISLLAGLGEEALFRGVIQQAIGVLDPVAGIVSASLLFGLAHPFSKTYVAMAALTGVWLGVSFYLTGSLLVPIVTHAAYDFVALIWLVRGRRSPGRDVGA